jgi:hypothetical protein
VDVQGYLRPIGRQLGKGRNADGHFIADAAGLYDNLIGMLGEEVSA